MYIDGVRLNEPFGDTLSWDLIPTEAIRSANLMPGSNPLFGLNTLGGALSLETKTGFSDPGAEVHLLGGSFGRRLLDFGLGGHGERWGVFAAGRLLRRGRLAAVLAVAHRQRVRRGAPTRTARRRRSCRSPPPTRR